MFQVGERKRSRRTLEVEQPSSRRRLDVERVGESGPLRGAVVCLTGLPADEKTRLHQYVEQLGGSYSKELDTAKTTHLIAKDSQGAKYDTAIACPTIRVVSPTWLEECFLTGKRANERLHALTNDDNTETNFPPLDQEVDLLLQANDRSDLFASCRFLLLGSDDLKIGRLIRRGKGTIYWELNEMITHIIVSDDCDESHREAARTVSLYHPNGPATVSPLWITSSWKDNALALATSFPPRKTIAKVAPKKTTAKSNKGRQPSSLFRGSVFALLRLSPPSGSVDYNTKELETCITSHGGQLLSLELLEALRVDKGSNDSQLRNCYVVCWGGYTPVHMMVHPLLSRVEKEKLCNVVPVTPLWLYSCMGDRKLISKPSRNAILFQPQSWSIHRLPESKQSKSKEDCIKVSVSGFVGSERTGIIQALRVLGAHYTENLRNTNTHLICKESKGPKYEKATKWGLHVVSVQWMYHIMEYGYGGKDGDGDEGCEDRFSLIPKDEEDAIRDESQESMADEVAPKLSQTISDGGLSLHNEFESQWSQEQVAETAEDCTGDANEEK